jgi:isopentenyl diphosphate isomerase/L-lactate dehydrogenase-like FMN-dependent dehydrogenase
MNTLYHKEAEADTRLELFGKTFAYPIFAAPVGGVKLHYSDAFDDLTYSQAIIKGCVKADTLGFTGDGIDDAVFDGTIEAIKANHGLGIPTIKPWEKQVVLKKIKMAEEAGALAVAMDIDAGGLAFLAKSGKPVSPKGIEELKEFTDATDLPFIIKGIMTKQAALDAYEAGAKAIVISNHGGRVLDETAATIDVLEEIATAVYGRMKIFIDGGFRTGADVVKALALGADAVLIARPYAIAVYGGSEEGVAAYTHMIGQEIRDIMTMIGVKSLSEISKKHIQQL